MIDHKQFYETGVWFEVFDIEEEDESSVELQIDYDYAVELGAKSPLLNNR